MIYFIIGAGVVFIFYSLTEHFAEGLVMNLKSFFPAFLAGYLLCIFLVYLIFDFFSLGFALGSVMGIIIFGIIISTLRKRTK